jgi:hypothetical protein
MTKFRFTGPDWLLVLLSLIDDEIKARMLLILWRVWHLRNDAVHGQGNETVKCSTMFLSSNEESIRTTN